jgi:hypothetical protein
LAGFPAIASPNACKEQDLTTDVATEVAMKKWLKIVILVAAVLGIMQLFRPARNFTEAKAPDDIAGKYEVPMNTLMTLYDGCYNCHSNYSTYPWYYEVEPVGWWMAWHIREGKQHLNFSEFGRYRPDQAAKKFHQIAKMMEDRSMPLRSYLWMHPEARLTAAQYKDVADWARKMQQQLQAKAAKTAAVSGG